jgi:plasmid maintenance system killer protein
VRLVFATRKIEKRLATPEARAREYGPDAARVLRLRISQLADAPNLGTMRTLPGGCHALTGDREGQVALALTKGLRLIFEPADELIPRLDDGGLDWGAVKSIRIVEVTDYHG